MKIKLAVWSFVALTLFFFAKLATAAEKLKPKAVQHALNASVLLHMKTPNKYGEMELSGCSGTYIDATHILTAAHCFAGEEGFPRYIWARGPNETVGYPVHIIRFTAAKDLALLEAPYTHPYVKLAEMSKVGQSIFNVGSPFHFEFVVSEGVVGFVGFHVRGFTSHYLVTTAMINPGSSGGGAFNTKGELVGVNTMLVGMFGWTGISLAVGADDVREFVQGI